MDLALNPLQRLICHKTQLTNQQPRELGSKRRRGNYPNYSIPEIGYNTVKSPGDLRRFVVTQTPIKDA